MSVNKINPVYQGQTKADGDTLAASEWNELSNAVTAAQQKINEVIDNPSSGGGGTTPSTDSHISMNAKGNLTIETTQADLVNNKGAKINIEPYSDLLIKPGDDISLYSHHRTGKEDEVAVKVLNGAEATVNGTKQGDYPVDLQLNAANLRITTKDKDTYITNENIKRQAAGKGNTSDAANIFNVEIKTGGDSPEYGYLKMRAQAIDLRCEEHGGIALQPRGKDSQNKENKIKFEHGGGDGLEFGTFNTEKTSIFTDEYRFNKDGVWKMATRNKVASDKADPNDTTTTYKYEKQADDFYDVVNNNDVTATTEDIIKTANAFNGADSIHAKITSKGNLEIASVARYFVEAKTNDPEHSELTPDFLLYDVPSSEYAQLEALTSNDTITFDALKTIIKKCTISKNSDTATFEDLDLVGKTSISFGFTPNASGIPSYIYGLSPSYTTADINIEGDKDIEIKAQGAVKLDSKEKELSLGGKTVEFSTNKVDFGEMEDAAQFQYKLTKKNATKVCDKIRVIAINNHTSENFTCNSCYDNVEGYTDESAITVAPGETAILAEASIYDIIKYVNWAKANNEGPWAAQL